MPYAYLEFVCLYLMLRGISCALITMNGFILFLAWKLLGNLWQPETELEVTLTYLLYHFLLDSTFIYYHLGLAALQACLVGLIA